LANPGTILLIAIEMVIVTMLDGRQIAVNPEQIVRLMSGRPDDDPKRVLVKGVHCVIFFNTGYLSVKETCDRVRQLMEAKR